RIVVPAVRQPSMLLGCLLGFTGFGVFAPYYLVGKIPELLNSWRWHVGSAVISVLAGLFMVAVCVFVVFYSVLFGTSVTWFDRDGAHVFHLLQPVVVVPWGGDSGGGEPAAGGFHGVRRGLHAIRLCHRERYSLGVVAGVRPLGGVGA
ncbi:hypothetical protein, partial [uncultured Actinomyces sp.]|uniref:hypothetical protein n=1 Tax=uncultured Actinomyces sp. TaxID=249061 RepID=UPI002633E487